MPSLQFERRIAIVVKPTRGSKGLLVVTQVTPGSALASIELGPMGTLGLMAANAIGFRVKTRWTRGDPGQE